MPYACYLWEVERARLHGVADQGRLFQAVFSDEVGHVGGHGGVVMAVIMRRVAVVAEVLSWVLARRLSESTEAACLPQRRHVGLGPGPGLCYHTWSTMFVPIVSRGNIGENHSLTYGPVVLLGPEQAVHKNNW